MDEDEILASGLRPLSDEEMRASRRYVGRAGSGVPLYFDPARADAVRLHHHEGPLSTESKRVEATRGATEGLDKAA